MTKKLPLPKLIKKAEKVFNAWIRQRDEGKGCISCGNQIDHAGHYFSAGHYSGLRFNESNVHGQCAACNVFKHGNLIEYGIGLVNRYGTTFHIELLNKSKIHKLKKWDREELENIIKKYSQ